MKRKATISPVDRESAQPAGRRSAAETLDSWLEEDSRIQGGLKSWEELKQNLDGDRPSSRPLFR